ncbi:MAG: carbon-nitrogen hydrolase family protein [Candidatus Aminicenantes bacterium]|nr:carbon-nitrogen hydrolase family protein [Candidatus Aminicenantes bacterium]
MVKIALIQQRAFPDRQKNLERGAAAFREAAENGAGLIAFAELAFLPFLPQFPATEEALSEAEIIPGPTVEMFSELARDLGVVTVLNVFEKRGDKTFDSSPVINADGTLMGVTRMIHIMEGPGFHEKGFYAPGENTQFVYDTPIGKVGVAICYDRHFPEYMRSLALKGAEIVVVPQAGAVGEWTPGIFEAELQVAAFQNGYYAALVNRVGKEEVVHFSGESYVVDPDGGVMAQAPSDQDFILYAECDLSRIGLSHARRHFIEDRRPEIYDKFDMLK